MLRLTSAPSASADPDATPSLLPPADPPRVLLHAPVNALWASNHPEHWRMLGVDGLLLQGVMPDLALPVWHRDGDPASFGDDDGLLRELRAGNSQLKRAGLAWNFVCTSLDPELPWFADDGLLRDATERFGELGDFCRRSGVRGLAIDTRSSSPIYDYRWDGYALDDANTGRLDLGARNFGTHAIRAFIRRYPAAEIIVIADDPVKAGPLWLPFFEGVLEAFGAAADLRLHLLVRSTFTTTDPLEIRAQREGANRLFAARFETGNLLRWEHQGAWGAGLSPLGRDDSYTPEAYLDPAQFRVQRAAAKLFSFDYIWVESLTQDYWRVHPREGGSYLPLYQLGHLPAGQGAALHPQWKEYLLRDPLDSYCRVGPLDEAGRSYVLQDQQGAALLSWDGGMEQAPLSESAGSVRVLDLSTGKANALSASAAFDSVAAGNPTLIQPVSYLPHVLAASLWMRSKDPLRAGLDRTQLHFGVQNATRNFLAGRLEAVAPEGYAIGAASFPLRLEASERASFQRMLQGRFQPGAAGKFGVALALPDAQSPAESVISRSFEWWIAPETYFTAWRDGAIAAAPRILEDPYSSIAIVNSQNGDLAAYDIYSAELLWESRWRVSLPAAPAVAAAQNGAYFAGILDSRGHLRVVNEAGDTHLVKPLPGEESAHALAVASNPADGGPLWILGRGEGGLSAVNNAGEPVWEAQLPAAATHIDASSRLIHVLTGAPSPALLQFDLNGKRLWVASLEAPAACPPRFEPGPPLSAIVLLENKTIAQVDLVNGELLRGARLSGGDPIGITAGQTPYAAWYVTFKDRLTAFDAQFTELWHTKAPFTTEPVFLNEGARPQIVAGTSEGVVLGCGTRGAVLWRETGAASAISSVQAAAEQTLLLVTSHDSSLRCIVVPEFGPDPDAAR